MVCQCAVILMLHIMLNIKGLYDKKGVRVQWLHGFCSVLYFADIEVVIRWYYEMQ